LELVGKARGLRTLLTETALTAPAPGMCMYIDSYVHVNIHGSGACLTRECDPLERTHETHELRLAT